MALEQRPGTWPPGLSPFLDTVTTIGYTRAITSLIGIVLGWMRSAAWGSEWAAEPHRFVKEMAKKMGSGNIAGALSLN